MADKYRDIKALCRSKGIEFVDLGNGHLQLKGPLLVNYYPGSKKKSAYVAGTAKKITGVSDKEAVQMCFKPPTSNRTNKRRKGNSRRKRIAMMKRGIKHCFWCKCRLTLDTSTIEHIVPLARGGLDNANNRTLACAECNHGRGSDMPELRLVKN